MSTLAPLNRTDLLIFGAGLTLFYGILMIGRTWLSPFTPAVEISLSPWALPAYAAYSLLRIALAYTISLAFALVYGYIAAYYAKAERMMIPLLDILQSIPVLSFLPGVMLAMVALFPVVLLVLIRMGGGLGIASVLLMLLGTQWYILFNVIAGAMSIPTDLKEAAGVFRFGQVDRWRLLILPGVFPYLVTGMVTAAGGAWNASIVAEYFHFKGQILSTTGLGATISHATDAGNFELLLAATIVMAAMVVTINRLVWRRLYSLAETRFKLET